MIEYALPCGHAQRFARDSNAPGQNCAICEIERLKLEKTEKDIPDDPNLSLIHI